MITLGLGSAICVCVCFAVFYWTFQMKFSLGELSASLMLLTEKNAVLELKIRQKETGVAERMDELIDRMQKVSSIQYLAPENVAVSSSESPRP